MTTTLPVLRVKTKHSEYLIDQNAGTVTRKRVHEDAANFGSFLSEPEPYREIFSELRVGGNLVITYQSGSYSVSTPIQSIEEVLPDVV
jgi:hypothetical protein